MVDTIMKESMLTEVYKSCYINLEKNLILNHISIHYTKPNMTHTYSKLHKHIDKACPYRADSSRQSQYIISYMINISLEALMKRKKSTNGTDEDEDVELWAKLEDLNVELKV